MLDKEAFRKYLKRGGRSESAIKRFFVYVNEVENYLQDRGTQLDDANRDDLEAFSDWAKDNSKTPATLHFWALRYYYDFNSNEKMHRVAGELRQERIKRKPFLLRKFRGVNPEYVDRLAEAGVKNIEQMLEHGKTRTSRQKLSEKTGVPVEAVLEFVKLSDLGRIQGIKTIRARLYHDAGVDTIEKMSQWDPKELRTYLLEYVEKTGFDGIAPLPKEAEYSVKKAKKLPKIVEY
jgi:hypothetical protein